MSNLEKICKVWSDLEKAYAEQISIYKQTFTKLQYLKKIAFIKEDKFSVGMFHAILGAELISYTEEEQKTFEEIQNLIQSTANYIISNKLTEVEDLNDVVKSSLTKAIVEDITAMQAFDMNDCYMLNDETEFNDLQELFKMGIYDTAVYEEDGTTKVAKVQAFYNNYMYLMDNREAQIFKVLLETGVLQMTDIRNKVHEYLHYYEEVSSTAFLDCNMYVEKNNCILFADMELPITEEAIFEMENLKFYTFKVQGKFKEETLVFFRR